MTFWLTLSRSGTTNVVPLVTLATLGFRAAEWDQGLE